MIALLALLALQDPLPPRLLDGFESTTPWSTHPADGVEASIAPDSGRHGKALRMAFDFKGGGGYAIIRRQLPVELPANYAFSFWIKGKARPNTLEFKLVDATGENVWWYTERDRAFDGEWHEIVIRKRQVAFAWGPQGGGELKRMAALELVITAGAGGGAGEIWFDDLRLIPREPIRTSNEPIVARASASRAGSPAEQAVDGDTTTAWRTPLAPSLQTLQLDLRTVREFGGITLQWARGEAARDYDVALSEDGRRWRTVARKRRANGGRDDLFLPESEARHLRLTLRAAEGRRGYGLAELILQPIAYGAGRNAFLQSIAAAAHPGTYPRYYSGERAYWTVVGQDGAMEEALFNEDGAIEAGKGLFSIEPFLADSGLITWRDVQRSAALRDGMLPMPSVEWTISDRPYQLSITPFAVGPASASSVVARYRLRNSGTTARHPTLYLALRPLQVNPPWQFLNTTGGYARVDSLRWTGTSLRVNADRAVIPLTRPSAIAATDFDAGEIVQHLLAGKLPPLRAARDADGLASGVLAYRLTIAPGDSAVVSIEIPLTANGGPNLPAGDPAVVEGALAEVAGAWHERLDRASISLPRSPSADPSGQSADHLSRTIQSTIGWILINRDGPALQPGSRSYERSWIRDGALTGAALLRFGHADVVKSFIEWYAAYQYPNGKVPCCVDARGADPVPEHDSHGEFIYIVMEYYRHTGDRPLLERMWPHVAGAVSYLDSLRQSRRTDEYRQPGREHFFGLLPPSISHEGYSAKPMHSYWDDFFAYRGLADAAAMAALLGHTDEAARFNAMRDEFRTDLIASLQRSMAVHHIDYLPGAADLGDFDATSTTIGVTPGGLLGILPDRALRRTFERYWQETIDRRDDRRAWEAYTPYELRTVGTMLRLGEKDRALQLLDMFLQDQEPVAWNQWPEVIWHDRRAPKFIGDSPHTWVGSDFLRSAADLFLYERERDSALVVGAGIRDVWLDGPGVAVQRLSSWWGPVSYTARRASGQVRYHIDTGTVPPGGLVVVAPEGAARVRRGEGPAQPVPPDGVLLRSLPADLTFE
jgi:hypothetical protein